jgi:hypothetical protein
LAYAAHDWHIFPLKPQGKEPLTSAGYLDATADITTIKQWWRRWPRANIGLAPAPSGLLVLDIDGPIGEESAARLGLLAEPTLVCTTGRTDGGRHLYFTHPGFVVSNKGLAPKLDVRSDMGYVVLPPSIHPTGVPYRWSGSRNDLRDLPPAALGALRAVQHEAVPAIALNRAADIASLEQVGEGARDELLTSWAGRLFAKGLLATEVYETLLNMNATRCRPALPVADILRIVRSIGGREGAKPARHTETGQTLRIAEDEEESPPSFAAIAEAQAAAAVERGRADLSDAPRWAFTDLHAMVGEMLPGDFWVVGSLMGNGKTALLLSQMDAFAEARTPLEYLPLELEPKDLRRRWAAWKLGLDPVAVARNHWHKLPEGAQQQHEEMIARQAACPFVHFPPERSVTLGRLAYWVEAAVNEYGAKIVMIDHFHRLDFGPASSNFRVQVTETVRRLKDLAVLHNIVILASAQLNQAEDSPLDRYHPPRLRRLKESAGIGEEADVVLMLSRRLRSVPDRADVELIRSGHRSERDFADPGVMQVTCRKHRLDDAVAGDRTVRLLVEQGRVLDYPSIRDNPDWSQS